MKRFLQILTGGLVAFMVLAIGQEWRYFTTEWFGNAPSESELLAEERDGAITAVRMTLELTRHLYASGGDPRFSERMPASDDLIQELMKDVDYLANNHRRQEQRLDELEIVDVTALDERRVEVRTRELWTTRAVWLDGSAASDPVTQIVFAKYLVSEGTQGWQVGAWDFDPERPAPEAPAG